MHQFQFSDTPSILILPASSRQFLCGFVCACVLGLSVNSVLLALITFASIFCLFKSHELKHNTKGAVNDDINKGSESIKTKFTGHSLPHQAKRNSVPCIKAVKCEDNEQHIQDGKAWLDDVLHQETKLSHSNDGSKSSEMDVCRVYESSNVKPLPPIILPQKGKDVAEHQNDQTERVLSNRVPEGVVAMPSHSNDFQNFFRQPTNTFKLQVAKAHEYKPNFSMTSLQHIGNGKKASKNSRNSVKVGSWQKYATVYKRNPFPATKIYPQKIVNKKRRQITRPNLLDKVPALKQKGTLPASTRQHPQFTWMHPRRGSCRKKKKDIHRLSINTRACRQSPTKRRRNIQTPRICPQMQYQVFSQLSNHGCGQEQEEDISTSSSSEIRPLNSNNQPSKRQSRLR